MALALMRLNGLLRIEMSFRARGADSRKRFVDCPPFEPAGVHQIHRPGFAILEQNCSTLRLYTGRICYNLALCRDRRIARSGLDRRLERRQDHYVEPTVLRAALWSTVRRHRMELPVPPSR